MSTPPTLWLGVALGTFLALTYALAWRVRGRIESAEDFIVSGRSLSLPISTATLLATWFGAGTLLTAADEVRARGLSAIALEPLGAGLCLIIAGLFLARPLWEMKLLTLGDFFRARFGERAEITAALLMIPTYFGWIAVQFLALASLLELFFGLPVAWGVPLVAVLGAGYTVMGGMWSVAITDAMQLVVVAVGLVVVTATVLVRLGDGDALAGLGALEAGLDPEMLRVLPREDLAATLGWFSVLAVSALGNLAGQDLLQRIFSARSGQVAQRACVAAGVGYILLGAAPVLMGLAARVVVPGTEQAIVPALASVVMTPWMLVLFVVAICAAVLSTIDGALLAPSSVFARNVAPRLMKRELPLLRWTRGGVIVTATVAVGLAFIGESAYGLLEDAYALGFMALFVPLGLATWRRPQREGSALAAMGLGGLAWALHEGFGWESFLGPWGPPWLPMSVPTVLLGAVVYLSVERLGLPKTWAPGEG